jgi:glutamate-ammonia-ligase adenylyltransferase
MNTSLDIAKNYSQFIESKLLAHPEWSEWVDSHSQQVVDQIFIIRLFEENLPVDFKNLNEFEFLSRLRVVRQKLMLVLGIRDLAMNAEVSEVMRSVSILAEISLDYAAEYFTEQISLTYGRCYYPSGKEMKLWIIGMGKLGGYELNVSSDIDLIFVYDFDGQTKGGPKSLSHHEWFSLLGKKLIKGLTELTADGFVFRVDMRLRPNGDSGPLVSSLKMLEEYFLVQGREWERYAWIKARLVYPLCEDDGSGLSSSLNMVVKPFVYRKYLDYGIIDAIRNLHHQIRYEANLRATQFPDRATDIKLGTGGIREIEFIAQMFQLIRGGQESLLRIRSTVNALNVIESLGYMPSFDIRKLLNAYEFFRKLEHRLQWWRDAQIHYLPTDTDSLERVAQSMGYQNTKPFLQELKDHQDGVAKLFADAFALDQSNIQTDKTFQDLVGTFQFYPSFIERYQQFLQSSRYQICNESTKQNLQIIFLRITEIQPPVPENALIKFLDLVEVIIRRAAYLSLLREYPVVIENVLLLLTESKWGTDYLIRHPHLLDEFIQNNYLIDPELNPEEYWKSWQSQLSCRLDEVKKEEDSQELVWNILRDAHHAEIFQTLLADLGIGRTQCLSVEKVSDRLSAMADIVIQETIKSVWSSIVLQQHNLPQDIFAAGFGVIAYGKLGGKELGYGSDLDLVFIYDEREPLFSEDIIESFLKLVRRFIMCCTTVTSSGVLFEIDTRLRPNGVSGLMVTNLSSFEAYQMQEGSNAAWVWEHQALTRARFCAGSNSVKQRFEQIRSKVISLQRDANTLKKTILDMRLKIHEGHPNRSNNFDLKHDPGGMVDIEFMIQWFVLQYSYQYPALMENIGNIALLKVASSIGILDKESAVILSDAYRLFRKKQHQLRLDGHSLARVPNDLNDEFILAKEKVQIVWKKIMEIN